MRRLIGRLLLLALVLPASAGLPSARVGAGAHCAMRCEHGQEQACCCETGNGGAAFQRCAPESDGYTPVAAARMILPALSIGAAPPAPCGEATIALALVPQRLFAERPDPVPRLLS